MCGWCSLAIVQGAYSNRKSLREERPGSCLVRKQGGYARGIDPGDGRRPRPGAILDLERCGLNACSTRTADSHELPAHVWLLDQGVVYAPSQRLKPRIKRTNDDVEMASVSVVETDEVAAVEGQENSLLGDGEGRDLGIGNRRRDHPHTEPRPTPLVPESGRYIPLGPMSPGCQKVGGPFPSCAARSTCSLTRRTRCMSREDCRRKWCRSRQSVDRLLSRCAHPAHCFELPRTARFPWGPIPQVLKRQHMILPTQSLGAVLRVVESSLPPLSGRDI